MEQHVCNPGGTPKYTLDSAANDSDKTFTVPTGKKWVLHAFNVEYTASADVGNRNILVVIGNGSATLFGFCRTGNVTASQKAIIYADTGGLTTVTPTSGYRVFGDGSIPNVIVAAPIPDNLVLLAGYTVRVYDINAVAVAADDMTVVLHYVEYDV